MQKKFFCTINYMLFTIFTALKGLMIISKKKDFSQLMDNIGRYNDSFLIGCTLNVQTCAAQEASLR